MKQSVYNELKDFKILTANYNSVVQDNIISRVVFSPDSSTIATESYGTIKIWDTEFAEHIKTLIAAEHINGRVDTIFFSPNSQYLAAQVTNSYHSSVYKETTKYRVDTKIWNIKSSILAAFFESVQPLEFSLDSNAIITMGRDCISKESDGIMKVWDIESKNLVTTNYFDNDVYHAVFCPNIKYMVTLSKNNQAKIWNVDLSCKFIKASDLDVFHGQQDAVGKAKSLAFTSDSGFVAIGGRVYSESITIPTVELRYTDSGDVHHTLKSSSKTNCYYDVVNFSPEGKYLLAGTTYYGHFTDLWDVKSGLHIKEISLPSPMNNSPLHRLTTASFSPDGYYTIMCSSPPPKSYNGYEICIREIDSNEIIFSLSERSDPSKVKGMHHVSSKAIISSDGRYIITPGAPETGNNITKLWSAATVIPTVKKHVKDKFEQIEDFKEEELLDKDIKNLSFKYTQAEYSPKKYQDITNNSIPDETKIVKRVYDIMMNLSKETGDDIYNKIISKPDEASSYYPSIEKEYRNLYAEEYSNLEHKLRVKTLYQGIAIGCDVAGDSLKEIVGMVKNKYEIEQICEYYFQNKEIKKEEEYALENLLESISNWLNQLDKIKNIESDNQKNLLIANLKKDINIVKSLYNEGLDQETIKSKGLLLTEDHCQYVSQHLEDTASDILGELDIDYSDFLI